MQNRAVPNIRVVFASVPNSGPNRLFAIGRIVMLDRTRIVESCASHRVRYIRLKMLYQLMTGKMCAQYLKL